METKAIPNNFSLLNSPTKEVLQLVEDQLQRFNNDQTAGEYDQPGIEISLAIKDNAGQLIGGVNASTVFRVMHLEVLWVADEYRKFGFGRDLVLGAEQIGFEKGCQSAQTMSFSFQAPEFYQKIGYQILGIYDGYPEEITEYILRKFLNPSTVTKEARGLIQRPDLPGTFTLSENVSDEDIRQMHLGLMKHVDQHVGDEKDGVGIRLVIKDSDNQAVGGLVAFTTLKNLILEQLWVAEGFRGVGLGTALMLEAEKIAQQNDSIASFATCFSFQSPEFFRKLGYHAYGVSDSYPHPYQEFYLIKRFN